MPRPSKRRKKPPDKPQEAFLGKDLDYEGWKQLGKCNLIFCAKNSNLSLLISTGSTYLGAFPLPNV